jgi:hypothetical protein
MILLNRVILDNGQKGGRVLIAEVDWQLSSVKDNQPGKKVEPRSVVCSAGSNLDSHVTGSFLIKNQSENSLRATLFFGGRKYGDYDLSSHGNQRIQADAWGVNPGVGWYVPLQTRSLRMGSKSRLPARSTIPRGEAMPASTQSS